MWVLRNEPTGVSTDRELQKEGVAVLPAYRLRSPPSRMDAEEPKASPLETTREQTVTRGRVQKTRTLGIQTLNGTVDEGGYFILQQGKFWL